MLVSLDPHDRDVERSAAKIEHENGLVFVQFVEPVGQRRSGRLVDDLQNIEAGELTGSDGRGSFCVVEIGRHRDHRVGDRFLEIFFRVGFQLLQNQSATVPPPNRPCHRIRDEIAPSACPSRA